ncbi:MAG: ABC transporter permease [Chloroflexia bacterium]|nr:ABC transporter permease [Chloroflexia bacterium]
MRNQDLGIDQAKPGAAHLESGAPERVELTEETGRKESTVYVASQWKLMWWKFKRHKLAMIGLTIVVILYLIAIFAEVLSTRNPNEVNAAYTYAPPQRLGLFREEDGERVFGLHVNGYQSEIDQETLARTFTIDEDQIVPVGFWVKGFEYNLFGFIPFDRHLIGPEDPTQPFYLLGADRLGQDLYSRLIVGTRISMSIGLIGVTISLILGIILGGISGYFGGAADTIIQRLIEFLQSIPTIPLWLGLAAALPPTWSPLRTYFGITLILSIIGWTGLARVVRGRFLSLREEEFVTAARLDGSGEMRIILRQMLPSFTSHIIASITLAIPAVILAETALSFLGLGLRSPINSWGVLLQEAQNIRSVSTAPWLLLPGVMVVLAVISLNFLGDGLRDAADPYAT